MENSVTFTVKDGTEYRLTYDNETGDGTRVHYLLHENGVLKLECTHHALPEGLTEEEFKSSVVPLSFLNCLGRTLRDMSIIAEAEEGGNPFTAELAKLIKPHVPLDQHQMEYVNSIATRGHSAELFVQLMQELQVERFAQQLNAEVTDVRVVAEVKSSRFPTWVPPTLWSAGVVLVSVIAIFGGKLFGWE